MNQASAPHDTERSVKGGIPGSSDAARAPFARERLDLHEVDRLEPVCTSQVEQGESRRRLPDREGAAGSDRPAVREDVVATLVDVLAVIMPGEDENRRDALLRGDVVEQRVREPVLVDEDDLRSPSQSVEPRDQLLLRAHLRTRP